MKKAQKEQINQMIQQAQERVLMITRELKECEDAAERIPILRKELYQAEGKLLGLRLRS